MSVFLIHKFKVGGVIKCKYYEYTYSRWIGAKYLCEIPRKDYWKF